MTRLDHIESNPCRCHFDWGPSGVARAALRKDAIIIVDVLSFSTSVAAATSRGAVIYPLAERRASSRSLPPGAVLAVGRSEVPEKGRYSLSPLTYRDISPGQRIALPSLNGGTCCEQSRGAPITLIAGLVNAAAIAEELNSWLATHEGNTTVVACGERQTAMMGADEIRFAVEDYLGAGAIISRLSGTRSPEAEVCEAAYRGCSGSITQVIWNSISGRELREAGFATDVEFACQTNSLDVRPALQVVDGMPVIS